MLLSNQNLFAMFVITKRIRKVTSNTKIQRHLKRIHLSIIVTNIFEVSFFQMLQANKNDFNTQQTNEHLFSIIFVIKRKRRLTCEDILVYVILSDKLRKTLKIVLKSNSCNK